MSSTFTHPKGSTKAARKQLAEQQPKRWTIFREFDFQKARRCHMIATISIDLALWNGNRSRKERQKDLASYLEAKSQYKACLSRIQEDRLLYQTKGNNQSNWRPIGGDSRQTEL